MCTSWVTFKQLCEQTDYTLKKQLNMLKSNNEPLQESLDNKEIVQIKPDDLTNCIPEDICGSILLYIINVYDFLFYFYIFSANLKNESPIDETFEYANNFEDDPDISSDSEEEEELSSSSVEKYKSKKYQKNSKIKILQPKKSYYKPKNEFICTTCTKTFRNAERLEAHVRQHLGQKVRFYYLI